MTEVPGIALQSGNAWIKDTLYVVALSDSGFLQVFSAKLNEAFSVIQVNGTAPANRSKFSCSSFGTTHLLLIGGDGVGLDLTELWLFDLEAAKWSQLTTTSPPIRRRSGHCSIAVGNLVYTFGGTYGLDFCQDLLIFTIDNTLTSYTYNRLNSEPEWPVARCCHTMTQRRASIWLFGGVREDGGLLSDLWELDFSLFPQIPRWRSPGGAALQKRSPEARCSCVSWIDRSYFFIAGGLNVNDGVFNEIWRYATRWDLFEIYEPDSPLTAFPGAGLLQVSDRLEKPVTKQPFAQLDAPFDTLRSKQKEYKLRTAVDLEAMTRIGELIRVINKHKGVVDHFMQSDCQDREGIPPIMQFYSTHGQQDRQKSIAEMRGSIAGLASQIIDRFPIYLSHKLPQSRPDPEEQATQLALKLQQSKDELGKTIEERKSEIELLTEHLNYLTASDKVIPELDCADFGSFSRFVQGMPKAQQDFALTHFYNMQLREYQSLIDRTQTAKSKLTKTTDGKARRSVMISRLSDELAAKFAAASEIEKELNTWRHHLNAAQEDCQTVGEFLDAMKKFRVNKSAVDQKIAVLEAKNAKLQQQIRAEWDDLAIHRREPMDALMTKLTELAEAIKGKTAEESTSLIDIEYPIIREMANRIVPKSTSK
jgi:hypothetical protein